jgi:glycine/D-amino acid oxidase-like deaminating enzyme
MAALVGTNGCFIAAGHPWGILMGPASCESMADLIATGELQNVNLRPFSPMHFRVCNHNGRSRQRYRLGRYVKSYVAATDRGEMVGL